MLYCGKPIVFSKWLAHCTPDRECSRFDRWLDTFIALSRYLSLSRSTGSGEPDKNAGKHPIQESSKYSKSLHMLSMETGISSSDVGHVALRADFTYYLINQICVFFTDVSSEGTASIMKYLCKGTSLNKMIYIFVILT